MLPFVTGAAWPALRDLPYFTIFTKTGLALLGCCTALLITSVPLRPKYFPRNLFSNICNLCFAQVSRWLPTSAARVRARVGSFGICAGQSSAGAGFLRVLRFPLPIFIPQISPQSPSSIIWGWYNRPVEAAVPSGLSLTPLTICFAHEASVHIIHL
jgi:hypothetical protein